MNAENLLRFAFSDGDSPPEPGYTGLALMLRKIIIGSFLALVNNAISHDSRIVLYMGQF